MDLETQDEIGQAAAVQGHVRLMLEAVTEALAPPPLSRPRGGGSP